MRIEPTPQALVAKLLDHSTDRPNGCREWLRYRNEKGYGQIRVGLRIRSAHRMAWEAAHGPVPDGLVLDHVCRNRACINPGHLEPVTAAENTRRGMSGRFQAAKTHCPSGHSYSGDNLVRDRHGERSCRECKRSNCREYQRRLRARAKMEAVS